MTTNTGAKRPQAAFEAWAEYYDLIHDGLDGDATFYVKEALRVGEGILEIGVGTGRIALAAVLGGARVTGVDNSPAMLTLCREKAKGLRLARARLTLVEADMRTMALGKTFALVMMPYRTFMHLLTPDEQKQGLANVRRHMEDDGLFIFDTWHATNAALHRLSNRHARKRPSLVARYELGDGAGALVHYARAHCDPMAQILKEDHLIQELDAKGRVAREVHLPLVRSWTTPRELEHLAALCGFEVRAVHGGFGGEALAEDSAEMVWVLAKKRGRGRPSRA